MSRLFLYFFTVLGVSFLCSLLESFILSVSHAHISLISKERPTIGKKLSSFKENINPLESALDKITKLAGVMYDRKDGSTKGEVGLIAEDTYKVIPNVVTKEKDRIDEDLDRTTP